jgi:predicted MFS family arabinose efflux permease
VGARLGQAPAHSRRFLTLEPPNLATTPGGQSQDPHLSGRTVDAFSAVLLAFVALQTVGVVMMPVVVPYLQQRFPMNDAQVGLLTSAFALAVALVAIPMGLASSRWGGATLFAAAGFFIAGSLLFVVAGSYQWMLVARFVQGMGAGAGIPVGTALISRFVTPAWRHRAFGLLGAGTGVGTVLTLLLMPSVAKAGGYRAVCVAGALVGVGLIFAVASQRALRSSPAHVETPEVVAQLRALARAARSGTVLLVCLMNFTVVGVVVGILTWTPQFLHDQYGTTFAAAAYLSAALGVAQIVGNPLGAVAMSRWGKTIILIVGLLLTVVVMVLVPAGFGIAVTFAFVVAAVVLTGAVLPPSLAMVADVAHGNEAMGATTGLIGLLNLLGSMLAPWVFGALLDALGTGPGDAGYTAGFAMLACFSLAGALGTVAYVFLRRRAVPV